MMRYLTMLGLLVGVLLAACAAPASEQTANEVSTRVMTVYRAPTCGCCSDWVGYVEQHGYTVTVEDVQDIAAVKTEHNIPLTMQSCHTALVDGYVIEGHVPVDDIERLLQERPDVVGIAVPGMPVGSPGMEVDGIPPQPFDVVTFDESGAIDVFSRVNQ